MMATKIMPVAANNDAELVLGTLTGNRDAFSQIVSRYQSLICSLAYSATGSLGQSEDLAQETFITAWKHLGHLRERDKLRAWLCGIARNRINNFLRREGREPIREAEPLEHAAESPAPGPLPAEQTITNEEQAILWRSLERIPHLYREPLILFYREHQSIETVAHNLDLTEDTVKQRLSRGRKLLQEQVLAFVEGALEKTNPGKAFTCNVLAALPAAGFSAKALTMGAVMAKGGLAAKTAVGGGLLATICSPVLLFFGNYAGYRMSLDGAHSDDERHYIKAYFKKIFLYALAFSMLLAGFIACACLASANPPAMFRSLMPLLVNGIIVIYVIVGAIFAVRNNKRHRRYLARLMEESHLTEPPAPDWEYRSRASFLGLPLIHICVNDRFGPIKKPVKAWIAMGDRAIGGLFAFGSVAIAPISLGGLPIGIIPVGAVPIGMLGIGACTFAVWAMGGLTIGWQACGGLATGWHTATGAFALACQYATGAFAYAPEANNALARSVVESGWFYNFTQAIFNHNLLFNLCWVVPMLLWWRAARRAKRQKIATA
jgi:RNA polymerase sigma factor (sigma-70 family)